jgi:hypothetical protein
MTGEIDQLVERLEQLATLLRRRIANREPFSPEEIIAMRDLIHAMRSKGLVNGD